ncbi:MAG: glycogen-binding domain-containing protein [Vicinamibacteria bacterium]
MVRRVRKDNGGPAESRKTRRSPSGKRRHQFHYDGADASNVRVTGSFCDWTEGYRLKKDRKGVWKASVALSPGRYEYRFVVDGEWRDDPKARERVPNTYGGENAIVEV